MSKITPKEVNELMKMAMDIRTTAYLCGGTERENCRDLRSPEKRGSTHELAEAQRKDMEEAVSKLFGYVEKMGTFYPKLEKCKV